MVAASIQQESDGASDPLAQIFRGFRDLAAEDHGSDGTVDDRVHELLGQEARIRRSYLAVTHGAGDTYGNQSPRLHRLLSHSKRPLCSFIPSSCTHPLIP